MESLKFVLHCAAGHFYPVCGMLKNSELISLVFIFSRSLLDSMNFYMKFQCPGLKDGVLCYLRVAVVPTAAATALDIDLSNISIVFISVSFATMVRLSTLKCDPLLFVDTAPSLVSDL